MRRTRSHTPSGWSRYSLVDAVGTQLCPSLVYLLGMIVVQWVCWLPWLACDPEVRREMRQALAPKSQGGFRLETCFFAIFAPGTYGIVLWAISQVSLKCVAAVNRRIDYPVRADLWTDPRVLACRCGCSLQQTSVPLWRCVNLRWWSGQCWP